MRWKVLIGCLLFILVFAGQIVAKDYQPVISGNYKEGSRLYDSDEGVGDYDFKDSWLKYKQKLTSKTYYYLKASYRENNFILKDNYDSQTIKLLGNFTYQINKPLRVKTELSIQDKKYPQVVEKSYLTYSGNMELQVKINNLDKLKCRISLKEASYLKNNKDNILTGVSLRWEKDILDELEIHSEYKISYQDYYDPESLTDKSRYSVSIGFEYKI